MKIAKFPLLFASISLALGVTACSPHAPTKVAVDPKCEASVSTYQGLADADGQTINLTGIVHGVFHGESQLGGFFMQAADAAGAVFVHDSDMVGAVAVGDQLNLTATVQPGQGHWELHQVSDVIHCGQADITTQTLTLPLASDESLSDHLFQRVRIDQDLIVIGHYQLARFGTLDLASERLWTATQVVAPGAEAAAYSANNQAKRLVLDDGSYTEYPEQIPYPTGGLHIDNSVRSGDTVRQLEGVLVRVGQNYHLHPVTEPEFIATNPRPALPNIEGGDVRLVAFNVLNYFNGDGQGAGFPTPRGAANEAEFERQRARTIATMIALDADIYALMEMENDGFDQQSALADLTRGLNEAAGDDVFAYVSADTDRVGSDAITQAIIYKPARVTPVSDLLWTTDGAFGWGSRPPLLQNFQVNTTGKQLAVVANHFKSKGGCPRERDNVNANQGDGQACWNALRVETALELAAWLDTNPGDINHDNFVLLGDFNAYKQEDPLTALAGVGYRNLAHDFDPDGYSYVFRGEKGSLDHVLVHESMLSAVIGMAHWYINADEPVAFEYPLESKTPWQQEHWYAPTPYRSSDHDPILTVIDSTQLN
ncbi:MAG: ExeM/NucH family extracellular endonuclease [Gammaproteobacteria bacterium]|nr:ExeM/NucH family extracellular endonuclease [Gammaproteobacteria bacterium]